MKHKLRSGEWVRSTYAAPWVGVVLERVDAGRGAAEIIRVEVRMDRNGHPMERREIKLCGERRLIRVPAP